SWWAVPSTWIPATPAKYKNMHDEFILNILQPYMKNEGIKEDPACSRVNQDVTFGGTVPGTINSSTSYTYNGLLQSYSSTAIVNVAELTVWWNGSGKANYRGVGQANPDLDCRDINASCIYQPTTSSCGPSKNGTWSWTWIADGGTGQDVHN